MRLPRVYPILDTSALAKRNCGPAAAAAAMIEGGAGMLQLRHKGHWPRGVLEEAERIAGWCHQEDVLLIVNDRADMAMLLDAGLHVGQDDLPPSEARLLIGPQAVLGFS